ncbi:MAG: TIGR01459 family HAD-type hydrolase [Alphaproteobacteria bacterium]|nr:TIGR01459 family HAD-type hydrolase [Alphaproteobacteria bacterium]
MYKEIEKLSSIENEYDIFIFDIWGVLHEGGDLYPGVKDLFNYLSERKIVRIISNAPRIRSTVAQNLISQNLNLAEDQIFTSGETVRAMIRNSEKYFALKEPRIFHIGGDRNKELLKDMEDLEVQTQEEANMILLSAYKDLGEDEGEITTKLLLASKKDLKVLVANPDKQVMHMNRLRKCAGYFADFYETLGGQIINAGKPAREIYEACFDSIKDAHTKKAIMIGDTFHTDIAGAQNISIDSGLVVTGNMGVLIEESCIYNPLAAVNFICKERGIYPTRIVKME